ncbi:MAG: 6-carboxytetrahydropterin synthase [Bacteroidota bacterium]|nr:6-carboxytetrahydropterin synthase [Bacteroidota bacterium]
MLSITKLFHFEAGHRLSNYDGPCKNIHGHSYKLHISITGEKLTNGILIDFKVLKKIVETAVINEMDHSLLLKRNELNITATENLGSKILWLDEDPTAEYLVTYIGSKIQNELPAGIRLLRLRLYETDSCYAEMEYSV